MAPDFFIYKLFYIDGYEFFQNEMNLIIIL